MKEALFKANDALRDFAHEYTLLVQASHPTTIDFVIGMKANGFSRVRAIELFSTAQFLPDHYTNCAFQKRLEMHHQLEAEMVALVKTVTIPGKDLYNLYLRFASREEVRPGVVLRGVVRQFQGVWRGHASP